MSSNDVTFADEQQGKEALLDVRSDATASDWCLFTYENPKSTKLVLVGKGSGGINELVENLRDDMVGYGLVRKADKIDDSVTIKFAFIFFTGENINRMLRAKLGVHSGAVKKLIGQYHVDIAADKKEELSESILTEKITLTSGSGSRVVDKETGARQGASSSVASRERTSTSGAKSGELKFVDEASLKETISSVRANAEGLDWVLFTYEGGNSNNIVLLGKGSGGVAELLDHLKDDIVGYGLVRKIEKIDESETVKFAYIRFIGDNIPRMLRARLGTHTGAVNSFFHPYHVTLEATQKSELSDDILMNSITTASGTKVHVLSESEAASKGAKTGGSTYTPAKSNYAPPTKSTVVPGVPKTQGADQSNVKFANEEDIKNDIKDVRSDASDINWALVGYEGGKGNVLVSLGKGSGGLDELLENLQDNIVAYGLLRETEKIDESLTVKFVHIIWVGDNIDRMHRAKIGTHKGAIQSLFTPYHCDVSATQKSELTHEIIRQRIQDVAGTATKVKNN